MDKDSTVRREADVWGGSTSPATLAEMSRATTVEEMVGMGFFPEEVGLVRKPGESGPAE
jgi:hypothetical protein